jgi:hypothetical protein
MQPSVNKWKQVLSQSLPGRVCTRGQVEKLVIELPVKLDAACAFASNPIAVRLHLASVFGCPQVTLLGLQQQQQQQR